MNILDSFFNPFKKILSNNNTASPNHLEKSKKEDTLNSLARKNILGSSIPSSNPITHKMLPIEEGDPFFNRGLIVFSDTYTGLMPLNGIKESEFKACKEYLIKFTNGETKLRIGEGVHEESKEKFKEMIINLLTRQIGRDLLNAIECCNFPKVTLMPGEEWLARTDNLIVFANLSAQGIYFSINSEGEKVYHIKPNFISLAHELIHILHENSDPKNKLNLKKPTMSLTSQSPEIDFDNQEEQYTIAGLKEVIQFNRETTLSSDFFENFDAYDTSAFYDRFNENNFLAAFSTTKNPLPPRINHRAIDFRGSSSKTVVNLDTFKEKDLKSTAFISTVKAIIDNNLIGDVPKLLTVMKEQGIEIDSTLIGPFNLLQYAQLTGKTEIALCLKKRGAVKEMLDLTVPDESGRTPLHFAIAFSDAKLTKKLLKMDILISDEHRGLTALDLSWRVFSQGGSKGTLESNAKILNMLMFKSSKNEITTFYEKLDQGGIGLRFALNEVLNESSPQKLKNFATLLKYAPVEVLESFYEQTHLLEQADQSNRSEVITIIFKFAPQMMLQDFYEKTFLSDSEKSTDWCNELIRHVKNLNDKDSEGTPFLNRLLLSNLSEKQKIVHLKLLFQRVNLGTIDRNAVDNKGNNYLHVCSLAILSPEIVLELPMATKENLKLKNLEGKTPVELANSLNQSELAENLEISV